MAKAKTPRVSKSTSNQVITMPETSSAPQLKKNLSPANPTPIDLEAQIRQRAFELYQERGNTPGDENEDWLRAEREVLARQNQKQTA